MKLSRSDRLLLSNQYRILEALYPDEKRDFENIREAIEMGYEIEYDWQTQFIDKDVVTVDECREVIDILSMFDALKIGYENLEDKSDIDEFKVKFLGFDGNNETKQMCYARYLKKNNKFTNLDSLDNFNSHMPVMSIYRRMLEEWKRSDNKYKLNKNDITRITKTRSITNLIEQITPFTDDETLDELREQIYNLRQKSEFENEINR